MYNSPIYNGTFMYLNNNQLCELIIGSLIFIVLFIIYNFIIQSGSIIDTIYCYFAFILVYYLANLSYNFVVRYL